jgi:hypothetical protein
MNHSSPVQRPNNFARKAMTGVHGQADANGTEAVRLFYIPVNLTVPLK